MNSTGTFEKIIILDFGSQYTQLIAKRIRKLGYYSEILPFHTALNKLQSPEIKGIILSGGPESVYKKQAPKISKALFELHKPILGICYGLQLMVKVLGGKVIRAKEHEYGKTQLKILRSSPLLSKLPKKSIVWMSHADKIKSLPDGFKNCGVTESCEFTVIVNKNQRFIGIQFHPEVTHTKFGKVILDNFIKYYCKMKKNWVLEDFIQKTTAQIRKRVGKDKVIMAVSGGVDSTVSAILMSRAIKKNLIAVFINNGLLRKDEIKEVKRNLKTRLKINLKVIDGSELFLKCLRGVIDPEKKRKIIGRVFIDLFEQVAKDYKDVKYLCQGTLYPDVIESVSVKGPSSTIKSHHNVGGLPARMKLKLIEPLRELFKDEVRELGEKLNIPLDILNRHPFPGPGLAIRILGEITEARLKILKEADAIYIDELKSRKIYDEIWQAFCVLLPVKTVGVMGDARTYENVIALRAVNSHDGMTANWYNFDPDILAEISSKIINKVTGVNRVVYDISNKPPATIEWE